jgi:hypothetical protein
MEPHVWFGWVLAWTVVPYSILAAWKYMHRLYSTF